MCGWVHFERSGLSNPNELEKSHNFRCTSCAKNTKLACRKRRPLFLQKPRLQKIFTTPKKKAAFGSRQALIKVAPKGAQCKQTDKYLSQSETYTKFPASRNKSSRLQVQSYRINEIWSGDLAGLHQLARQNDGTKFRLVFLDHLSRFLRVEPIESKSASHTKCALQKVSKKK